MDMTVILSFFLSVPEQVKLLVASMVELTTFDKLYPGGFNKVWEVISCEPVFNANFQC